MPILALLMGLLLLHAANAEARLFPPDAGIVNVRDHGAVGNGLADDTAAIRRAVIQGIERGRYATPAFVYFPVGIYRVTGPIESRVADAGWSGGWRSGMILVGENRTGSVIRLADACPGYGDTNAPRWVVATGSESDARTKPGDKPLDGGGNRAFRHAVMNLTIDTGHGNPGAVALDFIANNRGTVEEVTLRSGDGAGFCGLRLERHWPGPALVKDVAIDGFDYGVRVGHYQYSMTFEGLALRGQRVAGVVNHQNLLAMRDVTSENRVPAIRTETVAGLIVLLDSRLAGGLPDATAILGENKLFVRNVTSAGYGTAVDDRPRKRTVPAANGDSETRVALYTSDAYAANGATPTPLNLPVAETPVFIPADSGQWITPAAFGATNGVSDATEAIQQALDSGKPAVGLPNGSWRVSCTLVLRNKALRLLTGFQSSLDAKGVDPLLRFEGDGTAVVEHLRLGGAVEHAGKGTLALRHCDFEGYRNTPAGTGDMFFEDTIGKPIRVLYPQRLFGRQVNCEFGKEPLIENHGGTVWLLGFKTEGEMVCYRQIAGLGEILGAQFYPLGKRNPLGPAILVEGGACSASVTMNERGYQMAIGATAGDVAQGVTAAQYGGRAAALLRCGRAQSGQ